MRGKPKGINRKQAKEMNSVMGKLMVSLFGEAGTSPAAQPFLESRMTPQAISDMEGPSNPFTAEEWAKAKKGMGKAQNNAEEKFKELSGDALKNQDAVFFEKLATLTKLSKDKKALAADVLGTRVLLIWVLLRILKFSGSSSEITEHLSTHFPRADGNDYDEAQIRRVMRGLGLPGISMGGH